MTIHDERYDPDWNRLAVADLADLKGFAVSTLRAIGFDLSGSRFEVVPLHHCDMLEIDHGPAPRDKTFVEYPFDHQWHGRGRVPNPHLLDALLAGAHRQRVRDAWRCARREAPDRAAAWAHLDGAALARWAAARALRETRPDIDVKSPIEPHDLVEMTASFRTDAGSLRISSDGGRSSMSIGLEAPDAVLTGVVGRRLGEVVDLPPCGDASVDAAARELKVETASRKDGRVVFSFAYDLGGPLVTGAEDALWRRLRSVITLAAKKAPTFVDDDVPATARRYRRDCAEAGVDNPRSIVVGGRERGRKAA